MLPSLSRDDESESMHPLCKAVFKGHMEAEEELQLLLDEERRLCENLGFLATLTEAEFSVVHNAKREQLEVCKKDLAMTESASHMYEKFAERSRKKDACQFCRGSLADENSRLMFEDSVQQLSARIPHFLQDTRQRCSAASAELSLIEAQRPMMDRLARLRADTSRLKRTVANMSALKQMAQQCVLQAKVAEEVSALVDSADTGDVTLIVEETPIPAHRAILMARSPVFDSMLRAPMQERVSGRIVLPDLSVATARRFLHFLYSGVVDENSLADDASAFALLRVADRFEVPTLVEACAEAIVPRLDTENAAEFLQEANALGCEKVRESCFAFVIEHLADVQVTEGFKRLAKNHPDLVLQILSTIVPQSKKPRMV